VPPSDDVKAKVTKRVRSLLAHFSGKPESDLKETDRLVEDYGLGTIHIRALAKPLTHISEDFGGTVVIQKETLDSETLGDLIKLVLGKLP
jgi:hypothetical protein